MVGANLEEFEDENGRLTAYAAKSAAIWIPPDAKLSGECIIYPWPQDWPADRGPLPSDLRKAGWQRAEDTARVLTDFISLARDNISPERIRNFVLRWGPIWRCSKHPGCFYGDGRHNDCLWSPSESLDTFRTLAKEAEAAFVIVRELKQGKDAAMEIWEQLGLGENKVYWKVKVMDEEDKDRRKVLDLRMQKFFLTQLVNEYIGGISLSIKWNNQKPELIITTGLGFIKAAWLMIAQNLTGAQKLYTCNACENPYIRHGRVPQRGRKNFCPECGEKGSKRLSARSRRERSTTHG